MIAAIFNPETSSTVGIRNFTELSDKDAGLEISHKILEMALDEAIESLEDKQNEVKKTIAKYDSEFPKVS